jgi:hypothetical protein
VRAYSRPDTACRLLQRFTATYEQPDPDPRFLAGTETAISFRFLRGAHDLSLPRLSPEREERCHAASRAFVRPPEPRCRFLPLAQVCPTAIPRRPRHPFHLAMGEFSGD